MQLCYIGRSSPQVSAIYYDIVLLFNIHNYGAVSPVQMQMILNFSMLHTWTLYMYMPYPHPITPLPPPPPPTFSMLHTWPLDMYYCGIVLWHSIVCYHCKHSRKAKFSLPLTHSTGNQLCFQKDMYSFIVFFKLLYFWRKFRNELPNCWPIWNKITYINFDIFIFIFLSFNFHLCKKRLCARRVETGTTPDTGAAQGHSDRVKQLFGNYRSF